MVSDEQMFGDQKQVIVPPVQQFLNVEVKSDREQYQPQDEGTLSITAKDADGKPASAEIALGMFDESVKYIQADYAGRSAPVLLRHETIRDCANAEYFSVRSPMRRWSKTRGVIWSIGKNSSKKKTTNKGMASVSATLLVRRWRCRPSRLSSAG
jgi:hypothetical protein